MADRKDVVQGTLDLLVLTGQKQLAREKQHWKSITAAVEKVMEGA